VRRHVTALILTFSVVACSSRFVCLCVCVCACVSVCTCVCVTYIYRQAYIRAPAGCPGRRRKVRVVSTLPTRRQSCPRAAGARCLPPCCPLGSAPLRGARGLAAATAIPSAECWLLPATLHRLLSAHTLSQKRDRDTEKVQDHCLPTHTPPCWGGGHTGGSATITCSAPRQGACVETPERRDVPALQNAGLPRRSGECARGHTHAHTLTRAHTHTCISITDIDRQSDTQTNIQTERKISDMQLKFRNLAQSLPHRQLD
jgi:hypothetical protein